MADYIEYLKKINKCDMDKPFIFISYSAQDCERVYRDAAVFQRYGYNIWIDEKNLDKTKPSWKSDAIEAIHDYCCSFMVFYVSRNSLSSENCLEEFQASFDREAVELHNGPLKYICIDLEQITNIVDYCNELIEKISVTVFDPKDSKKNKEIRKSKTRAVYVFREMLFNNNNERVRVHPKEEAGRKTDYYQDIFNSFPERTRNMLLDKGQTFVSDELTEITDDDNDDDVFTEDVSRKEETGSNTYGGFAFDPKLLETETSGLKTEDDEDDDDDLRENMSDRDMLREGSRYYFGQGVKQDYKKALKWYIRAASCGLAEAQSYAAYMYSNGKGTAVDYAEAAKWYRKAAEQGHTSSQSYLAYLYSIGRGVPKDAAEAAKWYRKAAEQGDKVAQYNLGTQYAAGKGVPQDHAEAVRWYLKAAEQGHAGAQCNLGVQYSKGKGVPQDQAAAVEWFRKSAEQGDPGGQCNLGIQYANGQGVPKDDAEAVKWYKKSAEQGHTYAEYLLGTMYAAGRGTPKDDVQAIAWLRKAADKGHAAAQSYLGYMYNVGRGTEKNYTEAAKWYQKAADQGDASAQYNLALLYNSGNGVARDYEKAAYWFRKAAKRGNKEAAGRLEELYNSGKAERPEGE